MGWLHRFLEELRGHAKATYDVLVVIRHYAQLNAERSLKIMAAQDDLKVSVTRVEAAMARATQLLQNHPAAAATVDAEAAMEAAATSLDAASGALEAVTAAVAGPSA